MKMAALITAALGIGLVASVFSGEIAQSTNQHDNSLQELRERVVALETQVTALQNQLKELERRRVLTIPSSQLPRGSQMPPDSKEFKFNGQTYWYVPLHMDRPNQNNAEKR